MLRSAAWAWTKNINDLAKRLGYEAAAANIEEHFLAGRRKPSGGTRRDDRRDFAGRTQRRIRDWLHAWKELGSDHRVGSLVLTGVTPEAFRVIAEPAL